MVSSPLSGDKGMSGLRLRTSQEKVRVELRRLCVLSLLFWMQLLGHWDGSGRISAIQGYGIAAYFYFLTRAVGLEKAFGFVRNCRRLENFVSNVSKHQL